MSAILNEWSANPANGVAMDWVVTLPGQYVMFDLPRYVASLAADRAWAPTVSDGAAVSNPGCPREPDTKAKPAVAECDYRDLPLQLDFTAHDREAAARELAVSPAPSVTAVKAWLPKVANVVTFGGNRVLGQSDANVNANPGQPYGWVRASVASRDKDLRVCDWDRAQDNGKARVGGREVSFPSPAAGSTLTPSCSSVTGGVPVIGFAAWSRRVAANPEASYGRIVGHSYERGRAPGTVFRDALKDGGQGPQMVVLPAGTFRMGSPATESGRHDDEGPVRSVTIGRPLAMGRFEVTFEDYDRCVSAKKCTRPGAWGWGRGKRPVISVSWADARKYAAWLSAQTGNRYRLPTEAEWEYAARAGTTTAYSWGDGIRCAQANYARFKGGLCAATGKARTAAVGAYAANAFGLYDMHGNVWEWVEDCYVNTYKDAPSDGGARTGTAKCKARVLRGGSWNYYPRHLRSAFRGSTAPASRSNDDGFRLVRELAL